MAELYCFGRFTLNPDSRQLYTDGMPARLSGTAIGILLTLVERAGSVVSKDELISHVWGRKACGDNRLHVHVCELRKKIGDDCIVTKSGRGYRFVAPVHRMQMQTPLQAHPPLELRTGNLPLLLSGHSPVTGSGLIGRAEEMKAVSRRLAEGRLVTLTGPGGVGKTSLALHVAHAAAPHFPDGVWLVELATLNDGALVVGAVATVLAVKAGQSVAPIETLGRRLARKKLLIVLDNCEHVIGAVARLSEALLQAAPYVRILVTSREALSCMGEQISEVPPLALPAEGAAPATALRDAPAVQLFYERAKAADSRFELDDAGALIAARICRRLDGLPLAIEMVSGWVGVLGLEALEAELDGSLKVWLRARGTAPARHSTLRATLEWSHNLLASTERVVLRRIAAFAGGFNMQGAVAVAADDSIVEERVFEHLASLIRKSMVAVTPGLQGYRLLETTRAFAAERLAASEDAQIVRRKHAQLMLQMLERATDEWETTRDAIWLERYSPILDDVRSALDWAMHHAPDDAVAIAGASWPLWRELSLRIEGRKWLSAAEALLHADSTPALEARLRLGLGELSITANVKGAHAEFARAADLYRGLGDLPLLGRVLLSLAFSLLVLGRLDEAEQVLEEALPLIQQPGRPRSLASAYAAQVIIEARRGNYDKARAITESAIDLCNMSGADRTGLVIAGNLMELTLEVGNLDGAIAMGRDLALRLRDSPHSDVRAFVLGLLCGAFTARGDLHEALVVARQAVPLLRDEGEGMLYAQLDHLALRAGLAGRARDAARIIGYVEPIYRQSGRPREPIGERAAVRLSQLLEATLAKDEIVRLQNEGALLSEDQALTLALDIH